MAPLRPGSILIEAFNSVLQDMELSCDVVVLPAFPQLLNVL